DEVGAGQRSDGRQDLEFRSTERRASDAITGREVAEHRRWIEDVLPHLGGSRNEEGLIGRLRVQSAQYRSHIERRFRKLTRRVARGMGLGVSQNRGYHGSEISPDTAAVVVEHRRDIVNIGRAWVRCDELLDQLPADERANVGMVE